MITYSKFMSISTQNSNNIKKILLYPNPAKEYFYIKTSDINFKDMNISIFDISGRLMNNIYCTERDNTIRINTGNYINGLYFVKICFDNRNIITKKISIVK